MAPILLVVSLRGKMESLLSSFAPEALVSRVTFGLEVDDPVERKFWYMPIIYTTPNSEVI